MLFRSAGDLHIAHVAGDEGDLAGCTQHGSVADYLRKGCGHIDSQQTNGGGEYFAEGRHYIIDEAYNYGYADHEQDRNDSTDPAQTVGSVEIAVFIVCHGLLPPLIQSDSSRTRH